jgi:hypothetical protein
MSKLSFDKTFFFIIIMLFLTACDYGYPEVIVINMTDETILIKNVSFNGCLWPDVIAYEKATSLGRCLPGEGKIHFERLNTETYCQRQAEKQTLEDVCLCNGASEEQNNEMFETQEYNATPLWFNYQTLSIISVDYGDFIVFEITMDDMEQDFSKPGPYGH